MKYTIWLIIGLISSLFSPLSFAEEEEMTPQEYEVKRQEVIHELENKARIARQSYLKEVQWINLNVRPTLIGIALEEDTLAKLYEQVDVIESEYKEGLLKTADNYIKIIAMKATLAQKQNFWKTALNQIKRMKEMSPEFSKKIVKRIEEDIALYNALAFRVLSLESKMRRYLYPDLEKLNAGVRSLIKDGQNARPPMPSIYKQKRYNIEMAIKNATRNHSHVQWSLADAGFVSLLESPEGTLMSDEDKIALRKSIDSSYVSPNQQLKFLLELFTKARCKALENSERGTNALDFFSHLSEKTAPATLNELKIAEEMIATVTLICNGFGSLSQEAKRLVSENLNRDFLRPNKLHSDYMQISNNGERPFSDSNGEDNEDNTDGYEFIGDEEIYGDTKQGEPAKTHNSYSAKMNPDGTGTLRTESNTYAWDGQFIHDGSTTTEHNLKESALARINDRLNPEPVVTKYETFTETTKNNTGGTDYIMPEIIAPPPPSLRRGGFNPYVGNVRDAQRKAAEDFASKVKNDHDVRKAADQLVESHSLGADWTKIAYNNAQNSLSKNRHPALDKQLKRNGGQRSQNILALSPYKHSDPVLNGVSELGAMVQALEEASQNPNLAPEQQNLSKQLVTLAKAVAAAADGMEANGQGAAAVLLLQKTQDMIADSSGLAIGLYTAEQVAIMVSAADSVYTMLTGDNPDGTPASNGEYATAVVDVGLTYGGVALVLKGLKSVGGKVVKYADNILKSRRAAGNTAVKSIRWYTLSNTQARNWYFDQLAKIKPSLDKSQSLESQARKAHAMRNKAKVDARRMMKDREAAEGLVKTDPPLSWKEAVDKAERVNLSGDDKWKSIIDSSHRTNKKINDSLGVKQ